MSESFGARVRQHRERRGVPVAEIAAQTKIKASLLEGLERDDISQWPAGIYRRAYVRAYAAAIGYDADVAVREFLELYPEPAAASEPEPPRGLRGLVASALGSLRKPRDLVGTSGQQAPDLPALSLAEPVPPAALVLAPAFSEPARSSSAPAPREQRAPARGDKRGDRPGPRAVRPARAEPEPPVGDSRAVSSAPDAPPTPPPASRAAQPAPDLLAAARICTELGRVEDTEQVLPLLRDAAKVLGADGLIVWVWDNVAEQLRPALVHGYPSKVRARLRGITADADNVTAAAFRAGAPLAKQGGTGTSSALAIPLMTTAGCGGVLAIELPAGSEEDATIRAVATFFAAMLAQLVGASAPEPAGEAAAPAPAPSLETHPG